MKNIIKISFIIFAVLCATAFSACGNNTKNESSSSSGGSSTVTASKAEEKSEVKGSPAPTSFSWVKFDVPAGFAAEETGEYISVINNNNKNQYVNVAREALAGKTFDAVVEQQIAAGSEYSKGSDAPFGDRMWKSVKYQKDGFDNRIFIAPAGDGANYIKVSAFGLTESDEAVKEIMASLTLL